jgi:hypothetical protein
MRSSAVNCEPCLEFNPSPGDLGRRLPVTTEFPWLQHGLSAHSANSKHEFHSSTKGHSRNWSLPPHHQAQWLENTGGRMNK